MRTEEAQAREVELLKERIGEIRLTSFRFRIWWRFRGLV